MIFLSNSDFDSIISLLVLTLIFGSDLNIDKLLIIILLKNVGTANKSITIIGNPLNRAQQSNRNTHKHNYHSLRRV